MAQPSSCVALIPARAGSKRVPNKNTALLAGHPLMAYSIGAALESGVFTAVIVSTEDERTAEIARQYGAQAPFLRPAEMAGDLSADIEWVTHALTFLKDGGRLPEFFSILRPTSPFRTAATIRRAFDAYVADGRADSLRAMEPCAQHPGKMWVVRGERALPLLPLSPEPQPWHSRPYQDLPKVYVQNASLEIARCATVFSTGTISGHAVLPFFTQGAEGFDINSPRDWEEAVRMITEGRALLPELAAARP